MVDLPHRFVPASNKFVSPARIVSQTGHDGAVLSLAFSPCMRFIASSDIYGLVKVWCLDTLDILGSYRLSFVPDSLSWISAHRIRCQNHTAAEDIVLADDDPAEVPAPSPSNTFIPLLDAPQISSEGNTLHIARGDDVYCHVLDGLQRVEMEACERYVVALSPKRILVCATNSESVMFSIPAPEGDSWRHFFLTSRGDRVLIISTLGAVWAFDPMREPPAVVFQNAAAATAETLSDNGILALGDNNGNLTFLNTVSGAVIMRTPRYPKGFVAAYPSPEKVGFVALREESASAFLGASQEILSAAPLPATLTAACAGMRYSEVIIACTDGFIYRLKLDTNDIVKLCAVPCHVEAMTYSAGGLLFRSLDGQYYCFDGSNVAPLAISTSPVPTAMAINASGTRAACLCDTMLEIWDLRKSCTMISRIPIAGGRLVTLGKEKSSEFALVISDSREIWRVSLEGDAAPQRMAALDDPDLANAKLVSLAPATKSYVYALCETNHGQCCVVRISMNSGKSSIVLRIFTVGTQIFGASMNEDSVVLRNDANRLRVVLGTQAYSIGDWVRSDAIS
ncbi:MAG: WD40 domain-containing protein [Proteobacteria bacterium]|nr:WD40 domain-containing protein [Pseudomonadota bacterium]